MINILQKMIGFHSDFMEAVSLRAFLGMREHLSEEYC